MVEGDLPGPLERAVVLCRGAATICYVHICMSHIKDEMSVKKEEWLIVREGPGRAPLNTR
jgi:hypothetical protein